ncbi:MAG: hypothetical protein OEV65_18945, partial [Aquincola sp.]|nr:hypothetical protein [Aquincola sp.]
MIVRTGAGALRAGAPCPGWRAACTGGADAGKGAEAAARARVGAGAVTGSCRIGGATGTAAGTTGAAGTAAMPEAATDAALGISAGVAALGDAVTFESGTVGRSTKDAPTASARPAANTTKIVQRDTTDLRAAFDDGLASSRTAGRLLRGRGGRAACARSVASRGACDGGCCAAATLGVAARGPRPRAADGAGMAPRADISITSHW